MTYTALIQNIRRLHGVPYLNPTDSYKPDTLVALRTLACVAGMTADCAAMARPTDLVRIFACAASANPENTHKVAAQMALLIAKRGGAPVSPQWAGGITMPEEAAPEPGSIMSDPDMPPASSEPVQSVQSAPTDLSPILARLEALRLEDMALREELEALRAERPTTIEITYPDTIAEPVILANVHPIFPKILHFTKKRKNVFIWGPRGSGKTHIGAQVAEALNLTHYATGPIKNISRLLGYVNPFNGEYHGTDFRRAFEHGGLFQMDEVTNGDDEVILELNMALANKYFPFPDGMIVKSPNFVLMAMDNTNGTGATDEYNSRSKLDDSFMDRFAVVKMDYDPTIELALAPNKPWAEHVQKFRAIAQREELRFPSPRATYEGGDMINDGMSWADVEEAYLYVGMDELGENRMRALMGAY